MLRDILTTVLTSASDMQVVVEPGGAGSLVESVVAARADVVVVAISGNEIPAVWDRVLCKYPHASVLALAVDGRGAFRYELRPSRCSVEDVSPHGLLAAIRTAMRSSIC